MSDARVNPSIKSAFIWKFLERVSSQGINLITQIILARLLVPSEFGLLAIVLVFVNIANIFTQSGLSAAIVQKKNINQDDLSATFWLSLLISSICYVIIFFIAPSIEAFYSIETLGRVLRVISLSLFFSAPISIMTGVLSRTMEFRKLFIRSLLCVPVSGIAGILLAYKGFGVWSIVFQNLINNALTCAMLWYATRIKISFVFDFRIIPGIFRFTSKILLSNLLIYSYESVRSIVIGKKYSAESLAYYDKGQTYTDYVIQSVNSTLSSVLLPVFSKKQDDILALRQSMSLSISLCSYIVFPLLFGFAAISRTAVLLLLTEKWISAVPYIVLFCVYRLPYPIFTANQQAYYALGRSDIVLRLEVIRCLINFSILFFTINLGVMAIAVGMAVVSLLSALIAVVPNIKLIGYSLLYQVKDLMPSFLMSMAMFAITYPIQFLPFSLLALLFLQLLTGVTTYILISFLTHNKSFLYLLSVFKGLLRKRKTI